MDETVIFVVDKTDRYFVFTSLNVLKLKVSAFSVCKVKAEHLYSA